jgi:predicted O-methyltransferase YrrM
MRAGISLAELVCLCALARVSKARNILEIGTYTGSTTYHLAKNTDPACRVFTMDLPQKFRKTEALRDARRRRKQYTELNFIHHRPAREKLGYMGTDVECKVVQIYADSSSYDYAGNFSQKFDLIFIDGSHDYAHVKIDSANALKWVANNGFIVWHDYKVYPEITWGVRKHVDELRSKHNIVRIAGTSLCVFENGPRCESNGRTTSDAAGGRSVR